MNIVRTLFTAILLGIVSIGSAMAQARSEARITNLGYTLTDLDLNDGITPSLTWNLDQHPDFVSHSSVWYVDGASGQTHNEMIYGADAIGPTSHSASMTQAGSSPSHLEAAGSITGASFETLVLQANAEASASSSMSIIISNARSGPITFILSPMTGISISADMYASTSAVLRDGPQKERAVASAYMQLIGSGTNQVTELSTMSGAEWADPGIGRPAWEGPDASAFERRSLAYSNLEAVSAEGILSVEAAANGSSSANITTSVPEPATWGMLLGGLALLGARRRLTS